MRNTRQYEFLDRLRFGKKPEERKEALRELKVLESESDFNDSDLLALLDNEDLIFQTYAIGAVGRRKYQPAVPKLKTLYTKSNNPLVLVELLEAFFQFETDDFIDVVLNRLKKSGKKFWQKWTGSFTKVGIYENDLLLDQVLIPSLKYLRLTGNEKLEKQILPYLNHEDSNVRWHTLVTCDKLGIIIDEKKLSEIGDREPNVLVREQAAIIIEKRNRQKQQERV